MDLATPLRSLVPSLDSAALEVLAWTESWMGVTQISRLAARGSGPGLAKVLDRLVESGLVMAMPSNRGHLYRFNHHHLLAPAVREALDVRPRLLDRLRTELEDLTPGLVHASVFGSFARGDGNALSDIDLLLITQADLSHDEEWSAQIRALEDEVRAWTGNRLEVLEFSATQLRNLVFDGQEPVLESIRRDSVRLIGDSFVDVVDRGVHDTRGQAEVG